MTNGAMSVYSSEMLDGGVIYVLGTHEQDCERFHPATQNVQFKTHQLFISGIFHLVFLGGT